MRSRSLALIILAATALAGCATFKPPQISYDDEQPALLEGEPPKPVQVVEIAKPLPLPGQLKPLRGMRAPPAAPAARPPAPLAGAPPRAPPPPPRRPHPPRRPPVCHL